MRKRKRFSVGAKFATLITLSTAAVIVLSVAVVTHRFSAQDEARAKQSAREASVRITAAVNTIFQNAFDVVGTTNDSLVDLKDREISDPAVYDAILEQMVQAQPNRYGAWLVWNTGDAPRHATAQGTAFQGLSVYWHQNGMEMVRDAIPQEILASNLFTVPSQEHVPYLLEPHAIDAVAGDQTLVTSFGKPFEHDGNIVGVIALDIKLDAIADALTAIGIPAGASITVVSDGGTVAMSTVKALAGKNLRVVSPTWAGVLDTAKRDGDGSRISLDQNEGTRYLTSWNAIRFAGVKNPWYLLMKVPERSLIATTSNDRLFLILVATGSLIVVLLIASLSMNRIVAHPLRLLSAVIDGLGSGLFDFAVPCQDRSDEVGDIARAVVRLQDSGLEIARLLEANGDAEYQRLTTRRAELDHISDRFSASIETLVAGLENVATTVEIRSREVSTSSNGTVERLGEVAQASRVARAGMGSVASATGALLSTIDAIGDRTRDGRSAAEKVERHTALTEVALARLKQTIHDIERVSRLTNEVASQINLIALNATIEAARAGDAGRGFAVVAQEIKILATQTTKATAEIGRHITAVHTASGLTDTSIVEMREAFAEMRTISSEIAGALDVQLGATSEIGRLMETALAGGDAAARHVSDLMVSSTEVRQAAEVMHTESGSLGAQILRLDGEVKSFLGFLKAS